MVSYILIIQNGPIHTYEYYPNGEKDLKGSFSINRDTKKYLIYIFLGGSIGMKKNKMEIESIL